ncbi:MAG TPA: nif-specific transcriptional activator NifA [Acidobacteriaceae bacterium]|nr:nif-specific transcriptional activator NifA [Acidobacteriaceae bacterium]
MSNPRDISSLQQAMQSNSRANSALIGIYEISKVLTRPARLEMALSGVINLLASFLDMNNGLIALLDEEDRTTTVVGAGWSEATAREHFERLPEQAVGQIVVSGMPLVVRNIAKSPLFTDWSELNADATLVPRSFVGVPIIGENRTIGTIMIERLDGHSSPHTLDEDVRFLTMVSNLVGQTVALQTVVAKDRERLMSESHRLEKELEQHIETKHEGIDWIIGESSAIREVVAKIQQVARCNLPVLLCGESGTGKELFARAIHEYSPRSQKPYIRLNCAALSESVLESELFGHERGAFTGAVGLRKGRFELADEGTLFLDEIGEISGAFQAKLLRVLQEGEFERVGGSRTIKVDVRLVAATNRNLEAAVLSGQFRSDLYYRISVVPIFLPPLRERREDVDLLAQEFLRRFNDEHGVSLTLSKRAMDILRACDFPGNVRELESCVRRTAALAKSSVIVVEDFACSNESCLSLVMGKSMNRVQAQQPGYVPLPVAAQPQERSWPVRRITPPPNAGGGNGAVSSHPGNGAGNHRADPTEQQRLVDAMERSGWVQAKAARILGLTPRQMGYALRKYSIEIKRF